MLVEIIIFLLVGIFFGIITGLTPGIHINLIGSLLVEGAYLFNSVSPLYFSVLIVAMAITHTFVDFIPSVFLGCPDTDTELSALPGHEMLKKGLGYEAVNLTLYGGLAAMVILIFIFYPSIKLIPLVYNQFVGYIPYLLIIISLILLFSEKNKFASFIVFILTGFLGYFVLNLTNLNEPLLPLLTGLFGASLLISSINLNTKIPKQKITKIKLNYKRPLIGAMIAAPVCSFLPGLGSGQAAVIGNMLLKTDKKGFLFLLGATNTIVMGFSFITLYLFSKTRTGAAAAIKEISGTFNLNILILFFGVIIISSLIDFFITKKLAKIASEKIDRINYKKISIATLIILTIIILLVSHIIGLFIFVISTLTGIYCGSFKIRRINMMGCLLIPTIILYFFKENFYFQRILQYVLLCLYNLFQ